MFALYINSLYRLLIEQNPLLEIYQRFTRTIRIFWRMRGNMAGVMAKRQRMQRQLQAVSWYMDEATALHHHRLNITR